MHDIMSALYDYICDHTFTLLKDDSEYQKILNEYLEIEKDVREKIGADLLDKYQYAEGAVSRRWEFAVFIQSLRFGHRFLLEVLS